MKLNSFFSKISKWLQSTEMFARSGKQLTGKWQLFEYYFESEKKLNHISEELLKTKKQQWNIGFIEDEKYFQNSNLSIPLISAIEDGTWSISKNFITLIHPKKFRKNIEFQFAIEKGNLKLLKKDGLGKIEFFGFFRKQEPK